MNTPLTRREFLKNAACCAAGVVLLPSVGRLLATPGLATDPRTMIAVDPKMYAAEANRSVQCHLCPRQCLLEPGQTSFCHSRVNHDGKLFSHAYNNPCVITQDLIEKLPLNHFLPGANTLSLAIGGCNLTCLYCQNWEQSQKRPEDLRYTYLPKEEAVQGALKKKCAAITFTYTEPGTSFEYTRDVSALARAQGLRTALASAAYIQADPLRQLCQTVEAIVVTLKGFDDDFYRRVTGAQLKPVLESMETIRKAGVWLEIMNLVLPTYNDDPKKIREMCRWIKANLGPEVPLQFGRFMPQFRLKDLPRTPLNTLEQCRAIGFEEGLKYVYLSNVAPHDGNYTFCPQCKAVLIKRLGFKLLENALQKGACPKCGLKLPGVWE